jgi:hypothetical protein
MPLGGQNQADILKLLNELPPDTMKKVEALGKILQQDLKEGKLTEAQLHEELMSGTLEQKLRGLNPEAGPLLDDIADSMKNHPNADSLPDLLNGLVGVAVRRGTCAGRPRLRASRSGPSGLGRAEPFWNSFSCDLTIAGLQSSPAFLLGQASVGTPLLRQRSLSLRHSPNKYEGSGEYINTRPRPLASPFRRHSVPQKLCQASLPASDISSLPEETKYGNRLLFRVGKVTFLSGRCAKAQSGRR